MPDGRSFDIYIPEKLQTVHDKNGQTRATAIVGIQGVAFGPDIKHQFQIGSGLNQVAERQGAIVIYPHATELQSFPIQATGWSVPGRQNILNPNPEINDVEAISKMVSYVRENVIPIVDKVGLIGHSDGGRMAQVYATERPQDVAALVAWNTTWMKDDAAPKTGLPATIVMSTNDVTLPIGGGRGESTELSKVVLPNSVDHSRPLMMQEIWSNANQCTGDIKATINNKMLLGEFVGCKNPVTLYTLFTSGHELSDWHTLRPNIVPFGLAKDRRDKSLNMTHELVSKHLMPYLAKDAKE